MGVVGGVDLEPGVPTFERLNDLWTRLSAYPAWDVAFEFALIWIVVYGIVRFVQGTRAAGALKGLFVVMLAVIVTSRIANTGERFERLSYLFDKFLALVALSLIVIFQPELRRALIRLGETPFFRGTPPEIAQMVDEISAACRYLSKARMGGLIVIERQVGLAGLVEEGTVLNAQLTSQLLQTVFFPGSALHDLAVVIKGKVVHAAGVQLPLAEPAEMPDSSLGSRHRAAVGVTKESDALVIVVSEETGKIRLAERGKLSDPMGPDEFPDRLRERLERGPRALDSANPGTDRPIMHLDDDAGALNGEADR